MTEERKGGQQIGDPLACGSRPREEEHDCLCVTNVEVKRKIPLQAGEGGGGMTTSRNSWALGLMYAIVAVCN